MRTQEQILRDQKHLENIVEFLATTQIAESNHGNRNYAKARTIGMNKLARSLLRSIGEEKTNFKDAFIWKTENPYSYPPVGDGGADRARHAMCSVTRFGARCDNMSDDSDSED
ncbi:unnamed protein product, partial [Rotaria sp. Silwood1]